MIKSVAPAPMKLINTDEQQSAVILGVNAGTLRGEKKYGLSLF